MPANICIYPLHRIGFRCLRKYIALFAAVFFSLSLVACTSQEVKKPSIIEIIGKNGTDLNPQMLVNISRQQDLPAGSVYQWHNHLLIYGTSKETDNLRRQIALKYPKALVKVYDKTYYDFNRKYCDDKSTAKKWNNIILTANLVNDTVMQKEYLQYHATQFKNWPEVAEGFCHAGFQQLLGFKNGRQLMLVISIPAGESLDELNPKTTENNPRVDEWNALMKKYQEGIEGTKPGEVWVFFKPVN